MQVHFKISQILKWTAFVAFALYGIAFLDHSLRHAVYPWATDYVEMPELSRAVALSKGESIYKDWESPPFHEANYTPIYTMINAIFVAIGGPNLLWGRLISLFSVILTIFFMVRLLIRLRVPAFFALFSALLYCSGHVIWMWGSLVRVDNLAVLFQISALWTFVEFYQHRQTSKALIWTALLLVAAAFTRQTMVAAAVAIMIALFQSNKKTAAIFTAKYAALGLIGLVILLGLTSGLAWQHLVTANVNEFEPEALWFFIDRFWSLYHWLLPFCVMGIVAFRKQTLLIVYFGAALAVSITIGKIGASLNYVIELWAAICMLSAVGIWKLADIGKEKKEHWFAYFTWLLVFIGWQQLFHLPHNRQVNKNGQTVDQPIEYYQWLSASMDILPFHFLDPFGENPKAIKERNRQEYLSTPGELKYNQMEAVEAELSESVGPILSEDMNFTLSLNRDIWIQPFEFTQLDRQGIWSSEKWLNAINNQEFSALVLWFDLVAPIASPLDATILSIPERKDLSFVNNSALFHITTTQGTGPLSVPWAGKVMRVNVDVGQRVQKGDILALTIPDISGKASSQRFPSRVLNAMRNNYVMKKRIGPYRIYFPLQQ